MRYEQQQLLRQLGEAQQVDATRERTGWITIVQRLLLLQKRRIQLRQCLLRSRRELLRLLLTIRSVRGMKDKDIAREQMLESGAARA